MDYDLRMDLQVIEQLVKNGSDLTKEHLIDFYLYFPWIKNAKTAAAAVAKNGFIVLTIKISAIPWWQLIFSKSRWLLLIQKPMLPNKENIFAVTKLLNNIAEINNGIYDGWETAIIKKEE